MMRTTKIIKGFTLIEMIIVLVIIGIISAIAATTINAGFSSYFTGVNITTLNNQAIITMLRISNELQQATSFSTITPTNVTFQTLNGQTISYSWSSSSLTLTRTGSLTAQIMNNQMTNFVLFYYQSNFTTTTTLTAVRAITINMTLANANESVSLINTIFLSNMN